MLALILTKFHLRRLLRTRGLLLLWMGVPIAAALVRAVSIGSAQTAALLWVCPLACALAAAGLVCASLATDSVSGLSDGLANAPVSSRELTGGRVIAVAVLFIAQMIAFTAILAIRSRIG